jgi:hypothetical protein
MGPETKSFQNQYGKINMYILLTKSTMSCRTFHEIKAIIWYYQPLDRYHPDLLSEGSYKGNFFGHPF